MGFSTITHLKERQKQRNLGANMQISVSVINIDTKTKFIVDDKGFSLRVNVLDLTSATAM